MNVTEKGSSDSESEQKERMCKRGNWLGFNVRNSWKTERSRERGETRREWRNKQGGRWWGINGRDVGENIGE